ncbi:rod shape-determining protein MreC [Leadbettera azotonutricia]|uniref:Cell shape-determining protein MreC n=1 Tax=Leadbettera azotonutricia (strain ATCC BAA-888 / DSM 13862 / ZAS-9) TaxID=545695 RepID=F5YC82_LEAAZ|nr:rod shape-determining protein MreC [Leadbettera azotonutricia]AEF82277.1 rod shape-determining protein MreC [Leadbettera azotonutricia ZAS-9]
MRLGGGKKQKSPVNTDLIVFIVLMLGSFSVLFFSTRSFVSDFKDLGLSVFSGLRGGIHEASSFVSRTVLSIRELAILRREYNELTERISRYEQLERSAAEIRQENNRLREQLGFSQALRYRHIPAELIGKDPDNLFSAFVINKGVHAGIKANMPVIAYQGGTQGLVGKVIQAGAFESLVMPLYDASSFVSSRLSESRYEGISEGQGKTEDRLVMRFIQKQARDEISIGEMVVTSGLGGIYPPGINIGRVNIINYQENENSMVVELDAAIDFSRLEYVFVIDASTETAVSEAPNG